MFKCDSSNIDFIDYNDETRILVVGFKSKTVYEYYDVDREIFEAFKLAESHGKFFNSFVKNKYAFKAVDVQPEPGTNQTEIKVHFINAEATKVHLEPGDTLMVTIKSSVVSNEELNVLSTRLKSLFPNNKVALFCMQDDDSIEFTTITQENNNELN